MLKLYVSHSALDRQQGSVPVAGQSAGSLAGSGRGRAARTIGHGPLALRCTDYCPDYPTIVPGTIIDGPLRFRTIAGSISPPGEILMVPALPFSASDVRPRHRSQLLP
jgi:hypothetical protein